MSNSTALDTSVNDRELIITKVLSGTPDQVFDVWTDADHLAHWWGPDGFSVTTHSIDVREGGEWVFTMHGPDVSGGPGVRDYGNRIRYVEVRRPSRLVYHHVDDGESEHVSFRVTATFAALGEAKTLLTLRSTFDSSTELARVDAEYGASEGMHQHVANLAGYVADSVGAVAPRSQSELATARLLDADPERVFDAFRDPAKFERWWGPAGFTNTFHVFDFRPGGRWSLTMHGPDGKDYANELVFLEIDAPRRLLLRHPEGPHFSAEFVFVPVGRATRLVFYQTFQSPEARREIEDFVGDKNEENLDRLQALLAGA